MQREGARAMAAWDTKLTIGLISGSAVIQAFEQAAKDRAVFADIAPMFATAWWNYAPLALLTIAGALWVRRQVAGGGGRLSKDFLNAVERLCGDEHEASLRAHHHIQRAAPGSLEAAPIEETERGKYQKHIRNLLEPARATGLSATVARIEDALVAFNARVSHQVAWDQFNRISTQLKSELAGESPVKLQRARAFLVGAGGLAAAALISFWFLWKPGIPGTDAVAEFMRGLAAPDQPPTYAIAYYRGCYECQAKAMELARAIASGQFLPATAPLISQAFPDIAPGGVLLMVKDRHRPPASAQLVQLALKRGGLLAGFDSDTWPPKDAEFTLYVGPDRTKR